MMSSTEHPEVFISYSWDSEEHKNEMLALANKLVEEDGIDCDIDQYHTAPPNGWPSWMENNIINAKYVLIVSTEKYYNRYMSEEKQGSGKGVKWESLVTKNYLADIDSQNTKFIPIVYGIENQKYIPPSLKGSTFYDLSIEENYELLVRHITGQPLVKKPPLGTRKVLPLKDISHTNVRKEEDSSLSTTPIYAPKSPFNIPFESKGEGAIGLEEKLQEVNDALNNQASHRANIGQVASFQGMGGLGKTQLAVEYAHRYREDYDGVVWLTVDQDIDRQIVELAESMGWVAKEVDAKSKLDTAKSKYALLENTLLIYDNVENYTTEVEPLIPKANNNKILLTSRSAIRGFTTVELLTLDDENAIKLLKYESKREINPEDNTWVEKIVQALDGLPLALEMVGAYMLESELSWQEYWELFDAQSVVLLERSDIPGSGTNHESNISKTLSIGQSIFNKNPLLEEIIHLLAFGSAEPINKFLLSEMLGVTTFEVADAIGDGVKLKFIKKEVEENESYYTLHRLVREVWKFKKTLGKEFNNRVSENLIIYLKNIKDDFIHLSLLEMASRQGEFWIRRITKREQKALLFIYMTFVYYHKGMYGRAVELIDRAECFIDKSKDVPLYVEYLIAKGLFLKSSGNIEKAIACYSEALYIQENAKTEEIVHTLNGLGAALISNQDYSNALNYFKKALKIQEIINNNDSLKIGRILGNIGSTLMQQKKYFDALEYHEKSLIIYKELYGDKHHAVASALTNVAHSLKNLNKPKKALLYFERALAIFRKFYIKEHPDTTIALTNMGYILYLDKKYEKALEYFNEALVMRKNLYKEDNILIEASMNNIANTLDKLGKENDALPYHIKSYYLRKTFYKDRVFKNDENILYRISLNLIKFKQCTQAKIFLEETKKIMKKLGYSKIKISNIDKDIKKVIRSIKLEKKLNFKKKGRYCVDEEIK